MDEKLIDQLYSRATSLGYKKSRDEFASLVKTDNEVFNDMFSFAQSKGLVSDENQFGSMVGKFQAPYKKKDESTMVGLPEQIMQTKPQPKPEPQLRVSETPVPKGEQRLQAVQRAATELPSEDGLSVSAETEQPLKPRVGVVTESTAVPKVDVKAIQKQKEFGDRESYWDNILNNINLGANSFDKMVASIPETAINILATPGNAIAYLTGLDIATNADKIKEQFGIRNPVLDWLNEEEKTTQEKVAKFNKENYSTSGVAENIANGNYGDAFELIGSGIAQSLPVSLAMMYGGATLTPMQLVGAGTVGFYGENAKQLGEEDPNMPEIEKTLKALGMASAETVFSAIGTGTIGQVYRDLVKKEGADVAKDVLQSGLAQTYKKAIEKYGVPVGLVGEGIEEAATQITQNVISGKPAFQGAADAFIIGAGSGAAFTAPVSGIKAVNYISDKVEKYDTKVKIENIVKEKGTTLDKLFNVPVADDITVDQVEIANMGKSRDLLLKDLEVKMKNGDITEDDAKQSLYVFDKVQQVSNAVKDLDVSAEDKATIASLLKKRDDIKVKMQNKDEVLLGREKQQIADINNQINEIILKPKEDAVQEQAAGQVPVQSTTGVSQQVAQGEPQAGPQVAAEEVVTTKEQLEAPLTEEEVNRKSELEQALASPNEDNKTVTIGESILNIEDAQKELDVLNQKEAPVVKAQVEMVQFPTAATTLETEGTGIITEGTEPVFKGSNAPTVDLSNDTQERYAEDYTADEIEAKENDPTSRVVTVASTLGDGKVTYKPKGKPGKKTFSLPFVNNEASKKIQELRAKYKAVKGSSKASKEEKAKVRAEINEVSKQVLNDFRNTMVQNLLALYDSLTPEFIAKSKQWYVGANRMAQAMAQKYNISIDQVGGILAVLSPQKDWFNNVSAAERVIQVMSNYADTKITKDIIDKAVAYNTDKRSGKTNKFAESIKNIFNKYGEISINEANQLGLSKDIQSELLRAFDQALHSPKVPITDPNGKFVGFDTTPIRWNSCSEIASAMSVFRDGSKENITRQLGGGNKVRNFYNNIVDPDSETPYVTADTHALSAALNSPISAEDASGIGLFNGGAEPLYALVKAAYIDAARIAGIKPREMQSITWEAQRIGINDKSRTEDKKNELFQYITESRTNNQTPYERASELIARNRSTDPSWGRAEGIRTQRTSDEIRESARLRAQQRVSEVSSLRGQPGVRGGVSTATVGGEVTGGPGVTETVKSQLGVPSSDAGGIEAIESRSQEDARKKGVIEAVKKAAQTFKSLFPDADIYIHETPQSFLNFGSKYGWTSKTRGSFLFTKNADGAYKARIDINLSSANATTVYHEVAHAVMLKAFGENKQLFESFRDKMSSVLAESTVSSLNQFADLYSKEQSPEEWLVELSARMSSQEKQIPQSLIDKIAAIVNKIVSDITNGAFKPFSETASKKEVIDFFNEMSASIRQGEQIKVEGIKIEGPAKIGVTEKVSRQEGVPVSELPGYDKLLKDVTDTLIPNAIKRKLTGEEMINLVKRFVSKQDIYKVADDIQRDELVRQVNGMLGEAYKNAPSAQKILGIKKTKVQVSDELKALNDQLKLEAKAAREAKADLNTKRKQLTDAVRKMAEGGKLGVKKVAALINKIGKLNLDSQVAVNKFIDYASKVFADADYADKLNTANSTRKKIRKISKNAEKSANLRTLGSKFAEIDPSMVEDIDEYNEIAKSILESVKGSTMRGTDIKFANIVSEADVIDYINNTLEEQKKKIFDEKVESIKELFGIDASNLTQEQLNELVDLISGKEEVTKYDNATIRDTIQKAFDIYSTLIKEMLSTGKDPFTDEDVEFTESQMKTIRDFMGMNLDLLDARESLDAVDGLVNFIQNKSTAKMESVVRKYTGEKNARELAKKGVKSSKLKKYWSPAIGKFLAEQTTNLNILFEKMFKGFNVGGMVERMMGVSDLKNGKSKGQSEANRIVNDYVKQFYDKKANGESFNTGYNAIERGMASFMTRNIVGTESEMKAEFDRRKGLIEQSIEALSQGNEDEVAKSKLYQDAYDKILADSNTIEEVSDKVDPVNMEAVNFWREQWASKYDQLADVSLNVYNKILDKDINYVPDKFTKLSYDTGEVELSTDDMAFNVNNGTPYKKETGVLMSATRPDNLPINKKNKDVSMYIDLSFDKNNANSMYDALVDINTAAAIRQIEAFMNSSSFRKVVPQAEDAKILKDRINLFVRNIRNKNPYDNDELSNAVKKLNRIATIGVGQALGGVLQPIKQVIPVAMNTLINGGGLDLGAVFNSAKNNFISNSGYAIANRGVESQAQVESLNKLIDEAAKSKGEKAIKLIEQANKKWLEIFLVKPDVFIARASWMTYYEQALQKQGIDPKTIDYSTHQLNEEAADYAQRMVDRQQNVSDSDLAGKLFANNESTKQVFIKMLMPFASFRMNQSSRLGSDLGTLMSKTSTQDDKKVAARSLAGFGVEMATFKIVSAGAAVLMYNIVSSLMGTDDDEEKRKKAMDAIVKGQLTSTVTDIFSPLPVTDKLLQMGAAAGLDKVQDAMGVAEDDKLSIYSGANEDFIKSLGLFGIAADRAAQLYEVSDLAFNGTYTDEYGREKTISKKNQETLKYLIGPAILTNIGLAPTEVNTIVRGAVREAKRSSKTQDQIKKQLMNFLLQGYENKSEMKRYDPKLYESVFGEDGMDKFLFPKDIIKAEIKKEINKIEREIKDEIFEYTPKKKNKDNMFGGDRFGGEEETKRKKKKAGFGGSKKFGE